MKNTFHTLTRLRPLAGPAGAEMRFAASSPAGLRNGGAGTEKRGQGASR